MATALETNPDNHLPDRIKPIYHLEGVNPITLIFSGSGTVSDGKTTLKVSDLKLKHKWIPRIGVHFEFTLDSFKNARLVESWMDEDSASLKIDGIDVGQLVVTSFNVSSLITVFGFFKADSVLGDRSLECAQVHFCVSNFRYIRGRPLKHVEGQTITTTLSRIELNDSTYRIILDSGLKHYDDQDLIKESGGFVKTDDGLITRIDGRGINLKNASRISSHLTLYLSFINGVRTSPNLFYGINSEGEIAWTDLTPRFSSNGSTKPIWRNRYDLETVENLWPKFRNLCSDPSDFDALETAIHWYVQANCIAGLFEGALIMIQNALELLYNVIVIEKKQALIGNDAKDIEASNKIRLLIAFLDLPELMDFSLFPDLKAHSSDGKDPIRALVKIRNSIVHGRKRMREDYSSVPGKAKMDALALGLLITECALLRLIGFKGGLKMRRGLKMLF